MKLHIVSALHTRVHDVAWVELNSDAGNFVIQSGHAPMLLVLSPNKEIVFRLKNGKEESLKVPQGIADISRTETTVIIQE